MLAPLIGSPRRRMAYLAVTLLWVASAGWFWVWWLSSGHMIEPLRYWVVSLSMGWIFAMQLYFLTVFHFASRSVAPAPQPGQWRVAMVVTKTPAEPFSVLRPTLEAMLAQDYPHDTWLADEAPDAETRAWCAARGVRISSREGLAEYHRTEWPRRTRCKEGNLAYFYDQYGYQAYDVVSQLDADHVPQPGYLREMLRPFADPAVGYVSAPSICAANASESWAARTRLHAEAGFHGGFQCGYTRLLTPMCIGSHYAVRTRALEAVGGLGPELAEDHSTTMILAAGGWRGVHAVDAIAIGDGPANLPDVVTQEFQWSRSLTSLLLRHTPRYLSALPLRLKFLFLLCQSWYAIFALTMALLYLVPIFAVLFDMRIADVTYPAFLAHILPPAAVMLAFAFMMRRDGVLRPADSRVFSWERLFFPFLQWPWVLWGCAMAVADRLSGRFVDFRITPKGAAATAKLPGRVIGVYAVLALVAVLPVLSIDGLTEARGFYLLALLNAGIYCALLAVALHRHMRENGIPLRNQISAFPGQLATVSTVIALSVAALVMRAGDGVEALAYGLEPLRLVQAEYSVAGAGMGGPGTQRLRFRFGWTD
ncbi:glycosyltransferase [Oceanicola sp. D3]|uniref:glycosyltransferase family 2 protein n=1 Tax=Oceanicola sp. D3 TaxID=2587163 RepID=UPI00111E1B08|nr:glycosyltransferase family 2 protein [Oceanicola sp. D3]QDC08765.1 glycosyltransferase [Oceanicola sp. D3]